MTLATVVRSVDGDSSVDGIPDTIDGSKAELDDLILVLRRKESSDERGNEIDKVGERP